MNPTLRGIGIRAVVLIMGLVLVGFWLLPLASKIAGTPIHLLLIVGLLPVVGVALSCVAHRFRRCA